MNRLQSSIKQFILVGIFSISFLQCRAQSLPTYIESVKGEPLKVSELEKEIEHILKSNSIPGLSIAIINDNEIVYTKAFGVSNSETGGEIDTNSIFEAASLSKPIFAYFVLKMVEKGILDLDKPLYEYLDHPGIAPESKDDFKLVTARMVLSHQTGFPNHANNEMIKLPFKPGTDFMYSGEAYQYLAFIIGMLNEVGIKEQLNAIFEKEVTVPLRMEHSSFVWDEYLAKHKVYGHQDGKPTDNDHGAWSGETFNAYTSLHTTAAEYAKFLVAMLKHEGLTNESFNEMLKEQIRFKDDNPLKIQVGQTGWGLGFAQKRTETGSMHLHTGNNHDFQSYAMFFPEQKYGIVLLTNSDKMEILLTELSEKIGKQF